jgi:hypothetical protein
MEQGQFVEHKLSKALPPPNNDAILQITKGSMPSPGNRPDVLVWLGLASIVDPGEALATSQVPLTYLGEFYRDKHFQLKAASKTHENIPNFLEWREDYHEGNMLTDNYGSLQITPLTGSLSLGYTNSTYNVLAWTNVIGLSFPEQAQLKVFVPSKDKTSVECRIVYSATVSSIQLGSPDTSFGPAVIGAKTSVIDRSQEGDSASLTAKQAKTLAMRLANDQNLDSGPSACYTEDAKQLLIRVSVGWRITDASAFAKCFPGGSITLGQGQLKNMIHRAEAEVVGRHNLSDFVNPEGSEVKNDKLEREIESAIETKLDKNNGIKIASLVIGSVKQR